jgi:polyferredoxin
MDSPVRRSSADSAELDLLDALKNLGSPAHQHLVQRTRRNVMESAFRMQAERNAGRQRLGITLFVFAILAVVLTPALWSLTEELFNGEHLFDASSISIALVIMVACTVAGVLIVQGSERRGSRKTH